MPRLPRIRLSSPCCSRWPCSRGCSKGAASGRLCHAPGAGHHAHRRPEGLSRRLRVRRPDAGLQGRRGPRPRHRHRREAPVSGGRAGQGGAAAVHHRPQALRRAGRRRPGRPDARALAQKAQADRERARLVPLAERKAIGQKEADDATSNAELAAATVQATQAKLDELKLNLGYTRVVAPISGLSSRAHEVRRQPRHRQRHAADGDLADRSDLGRLQRLRKRAVALQPRGRRRRADAAQGQRATTSPSSCPTVRCFPRRGRINFADTRVNPTTGTYEMRAELPNSDRRSSPASSSASCCAARVRKNALAVPQTAVLDGPQGKFVYVVGKDKDGKDIAMQRPVVVGDWVDADEAATSGRSIPASSPATSSSSTASRS